MQRTLIIVKPDGLRKGLNVDYFISKIELEFLAEECKIEYKIIDKKKLIPTLEQAKKHYAEHSSKEFFNNITKGLSSGEIEVMILEGEDMIRRGRNVVADIRKNYSTPNVPHENAVHGSDSEASAQYEIGVWFDG